jgi:hypothetical protein
MGAWRSCFPPSLEAKQAAATDDDEKLHVTKAEGGRLVEGGPSWVKAKGEVKKKKKHTHTHTVCVRVCIGVVVLRGRREDFFFQSSPGRALLLGAPQKKSWSRAKKNGSMWLGKSIQSQAYEHCMSMLSAFFSLLACMKTKIIKSAAGVHVVAAKSMPVSTGSACLLLNRSID